jgi:CHAT domain
MLDGNTVESRWIWVRRCPYRQREVMVNRISPIVVAIVFALTVFFNAWSVVGQTIGTRRYPTDEYYSSLKMLREGKLPDAQHGMETALQKARHDRDEVGIDAVPVIMRIGEALYLQGLYEDSLAQIENALAISKRARSWTRLVRPNPFSVRGFGNESRGILWHSVNRKSQLGAFPETWPVALGNGNLLHEFSNEKPSSGEVVRLDVFEIYLTQARGLWIRNRLLKTIAPDLPETRDAIDAFFELRADVPEVLQRSQSVCHGLALIGKADLAEAKKVLKVSLEVQGGWDHPLTSVGLIGLAEIALRENESSLARAYLLDASVYFARHEQYEWLVDVAEMLATVGALEHRNDMLASLEQLASWAKPRSFLAHSGIVGQAALLAVDLQNDVAAETLALQAIRPINRTLGPTIYTRDLAKFVQSRLMLKRGSVEDGLLKLEEIVASLNGNEETGPRFSFLIELRRILQSIGNGKVSSEKLYAHLNRLFDGPNEEAWRTDPMGSYAAIRLDLTPFTEVWLESVERRNDSQALIEAFNRLQVLKQRQRLPMSARDLDLRLLFHSSAKRWNQPMLTDLLKLRKGLPSIDQAANALELQIEKAQATKSIDSKNWSVDEKANWNSIMKQCDAQESRLMEASTQRRFIPQAFPKALSIDALKKQSKSVLGFFRSSKKLYGYSLVDGLAETWAIEQPELASNALNSLGKSLGIRGNTSQVLEAVKQRAWVKEAKSLRAAIVPDPVWKRLESVEQLVIIPDDWLWYVPFEILPVQRSFSVNPLIASCAISYAVTPSLIGEQKPIGKPRSLMIHQPSFFSHDREVDRLLAQELQAIMGEAQYLESPSKVHASRWSRIQFDQVAVAATIKTEFGQPFAVMVYDSHGATSLKAWLRLPMRSPKTLVLIGNDMPGMSSRESHGIEASRILFCLAASGNQTLLLNRWPSRGESSQILMKNFFEGSQELAPAQAWRRSVTTLWSTALAENNEFLLTPERKDRDSVLENLTGQHPIFWANTMVVEQD